MDDDPDDENWLPPLYEVCSSFCPTISFVPKQHRQAWGRVLLSELTNVSFNNSLSAWTRLLMLPKCVLAIPKRGGVRNRGDTFTISELCQKWENEELRFLWSRSQRSQPPSSQAAPPQKRSLNLAIQHARHGRLGKACATLSSSGLAPNDNDTLSKLKEKHPQASPPEDFSNTVDPKSKPIQLGPEFDLLRCLRSFTANVGTDGTNFRVQHLLDACDAHLPSSILTKLRKVINLLLSGNADPEIQMYLAGAKLTALAKGGSDIRPIAAGNIFRRIASKAVCSLIQSRSRALFQDSQVGVSYPAGAEFVVHSMRDVLARHWSEEDGWFNEHEFMLVTIDFKNAFNTINRSIMLRECASSFPDLFPWVQWCYGSCPLLFYYDKTIDSCVGVQQGDPLGPFLFCLVLQQLVQRVKDTCPRLESNKWYLDDGTIAGRPEDTLKTLHIIREFGPSLGLHLNLSKCEMITNDVDNFDKVVSDHTLSSSNITVPVELSRRKTSPNFVLLGAPIGNSDFCLQTVATLRAANKKILEQLSKLGDPQVGLLILRICLNFSKFVYLARTTPPHQIMKELEFVDSDIRECFASLCALQLTNDAWKQAQLSLSCGGLGLRSIARHCASGFISSHRRVLPNSMTNSLQQAFALYCDQAGVLDSVKRGELIDSILFADKPITQHDLSKRVDKHDLSSLRSTSSHVDCVRLLSASSPRSSAWLQAIPSRAPIDLVLRPDELQAAIQHRLGLDLCLPGQKCSINQCQQLLDRSGHHHLTCHRGGFVVHRHNRIRDTLHHLLSLAGIHANIERGSSAEDRSRPADVLADNWSMGKSAAFDITVVSPLTDACLHAAGDGYDVVESKAAEKHHENDAKCNELSWICIPLAVDSYGQWCREAHDAFQKLSERLAIKMRLSDSKALAMVYCVLGVILARQNALSILASRDSFGVPVGSREVLASVASSSFFSSS